MKEEEEEGFAVVLYPEKLRRFLNVRPQRRAKLRRTTRAHAQIQNSQTFIVELGTRREEICEFPTGLKGVRASLIRCRGIWLLVSLFRVCHLLPHTNTHKHARGEMQF